MTAAQDRSTLSVYTVPPNDIDDPQKGGEFGRASHLRKTLALSERLLDLASSTEVKPAFRGVAMQFSKKLAACDAGYRIGTRCYQPVCPRCQRRVAIRNRKRAQAILGERRDCEYWIFTATVATNCLKLGHSALQASLGKLRRRKQWRDSVAGGVVQNDYKPSDDGSILRWNVHCHALLEMQIGARLVAHKLQQIWNGYLSAYSLVGTIHLRLADRLSFSEFEALGFYVTKRARGDLLAIDDSRLIELLVFLRGRRIISFFGSWRAKRKKRGKLQSANSPLVATGDEVGR